MRQRTLLVKCSSDELSYCYNILTTESVYIFDQTGIDQTLNTGKPGTASITVPQSRRRNLRNMKQSMGICNCTGLRL